jgi:L-amino acid N-acyltransferase YncA
MADLHVCSWRAAYRGIVPDAVLDGLSIDARRDFWTKAIGRDSPGPSNEARIWVVEESGTVRGFAATGPSRDDDTEPGAGEVNAIYRAPEAWGRGVGQRLLARCQRD